MIQVTIDGRLTAQPEVRYSQAGKPWATGTIVSNERRQNRDTGEWEDASTTFLRFKMFGAAAEALAGLDKGELVLASGKLVQNDYEDRDGNKRTAFDLIVSSIGRLVTNTTRQSAVAPFGGSGAAAWGVTQPGAGSGAPGGSQDQWAAPSGDAWADADSPF